ncbi:hypothetical protein [uncultured Stenotrophomonas sp.]|uniref:hypothetical protein n=1 Tax=uncultured Stenotrophomonas sp. TaxID=165438 RepID=UPI0025E1016B|nr:hypothetical protein [uncultured Stenotrophomonas sp.]
MQVDPRTVARDIFGVVDELFPHLTPGAVNNFNSRIIEVDFGESPENFIASSKLQKALLFELAYSVAEILLSELPIDWDRCLSMAIERQRSFFDAKVSRSLEDPDKTAALMVGTNLAHWLVLQSSANGNVLNSGPFIPGLEWIASGRGDFSIAESLIEVKCTAKKFSSADFRQVSIYWLMSYAAALEGRGEEWREFTLFNPRRGEFLTMKFDNLLSSIAGGRTKLEILQLFHSLVGSRAHSQ